MGGKKKKTKGQEEEDRRSKVVSIERAKAKAWQEEKEAFWGEPYYGETSLLGAFRQKGGEGKCTRRGGKQDAEKNFEKQGRIADQRQDEKKEGKNKNTIESPVNEGIWKNQEESKGRKKTFTENVLSLQKEADNKREPSKRQKRRKKQNMENDQGLKDTRSRTSSDKEEKKKKKGREKKEWTLDAHGPRYQP